MQTNGERTRKARRRIAEWHQKTPPPHSYPGPAVHRARGVDRKASPVGPGPWRCVMSPMALWSNNVDFRRAGECNGPHGSRSHTRQQEVSGWCAGSRAFCGVFCSDSTQLVGHTVLPYSASSQTVHSASWLCACAHPHTVSTNTSASLPAAQCANIHMWV